MSNDGKNSCGCKLELQSNYPGNRSFHKTTQTVARPATDSHVC